MPSEQSEDKRVVVLPVLCPDCGEGMNPQQGGEFWICSNCSEIHRYDELAIDA